MRALTIGLIVAAGVLAAAAVGLFSAAIWTAGDGTDAIDTSTRLALTGLIAVVLSGVAFFAADANR